MTRAAVITITVTAEITDMILMMFLDFLENRYRKAMNDMSFNNGLLIWLKQGKVAEF